MKNNTKYTSATLAGCANQHYFESDGSMRVSRAFFKIFSGGEAEYCLLFSGRMDGSYRRISLHDEECSNWKITSARVAHCRSMRSDLPPEELSRESDFEIGEWHTLTFSGEESKAAEPGLFSSDPIRLNISTGEYLCLELRYFGERIPCHPECIIPIYEWDGVRWKYSVNMPLPCMIGSDRPVGGRVAFLGDSITQGVGTPVNGYSHWNALLAEKLGHGYSYWNLGIGYGKISDVASDGIWLSKAKTCDTVFLCFGVNDINGDYGADTIKADLYRTVTLLREAGCRIILQTTPPYDYPENRRLVWCQVNDYITGELSSLADRLFDVRPVLSKSPEEPHKTRFEGHPNEEGCALWADALYDAVKDMF